MSGPVVAIGYILLIPSILGILFSAFLFFSPASKTDGPNENTKKRVTEEMQNAGIPAQVINAVLKGDKKPVDDWLDRDSDQDGRTIRQEMVVSSAQSRMRPDSSGRAFASGVIGGISIFMGVISFIGGLLGWLLVMKRQILECNVCSAVVNAS